GENEALYEGVIALENCLYGKPTNAVPAEHILHNDRSTHHVSELQPKNRNDRDESSLEGVARQYDPSGHALCPRRSYVIMIEDLDHRRPCKPGDDGRVGHPQGQRWKD